MIARFLVVALGVLILVSAAALPAEASWGWMYGGPWGYTGSTWEHPPYFAVHPPVYYSRPIPRPYGYSPYPLPPVMPSVLDEAWPATVATYVPSKPLRIRNPFVQQPEDTSPQGPGSPARSTPQIIYPARTNSRSS